MAGAATMSMGTVSTASSTPMVVDSPTPPEAQEYGPVVAEDSGGSAEQNDGLGGIYRQGDEHCQRPLGGVDNADHKPHPGSQLAIGVSRPHVAVPDLPDVDALKYPPGNVGGGDGAEEVS
jgi:hypothetical protein